MNRATAVSVWSTIPAILATLLISGALGCSGLGSRPASADGGGVDPVICDGSPSIRLSFRLVGGGIVLPGQQVLSENGHQFLLVDGSCHSWLLNSQYTEVRTVELSAARVTELASALRLAEWGRLAGDYVESSCDASGPVLRFGQTRIAIYEACGVPDTSGPVLWLRDAARAQLADLYGSGQPVDGPVRFVLVKEPPDVVWPSLVRQASAPWPLASNPAMLAITYEEGNHYQPGSSRLAMPPDAERLREVRRRFVESGYGPYTGGFIPIVGADGGLYELFARDTMPLEDADGLLDVD